MRQRAKQVTPAPATPAIVPLESPVTELPRGAIGTALEAWNVVVLLRAADDVLELGKSGLNEVVEL